jgi:hypothetical protein
MKAIVLAFTPKEQDLEKILATVAVVKSEYPDAICIHGNLPRRAVEARQLPTSIVDTLDKHFPIQLNMFGDGKPLRKEMRTVAIRLDAQVCVIGEVKEGVAEEVELYKAAELPIKYYTLD